VDPRQSSFEEVTIPETAGSELIVTGNVVTTGLVQPVPGKLAERLYIPLAAVVVGTKTTVETVFDTTYPFGPDQL
jgi:electron transfer flavoprotein alpha/beta subunit